MFRTSSRSPLLHFGTKRTVPLPGFFFFTQAFTVCAKAAWVPATAKNASAPLIATAAAIKVLLENVSVPAIWLLLPCLAVSPPRNPRRGCTPVWWSRIGSTAPEGPSTPLGGQSVQSD